MAMRNHYYHSQIVRDLHLGAEGIQSKDWDYRKEKSHSLVSPHDGYLIQVTFSEASEHPNHILIRTTNWRCEYEPSGWITKEKARQIWSYLRRVGFARRQS